MDREVQTTEIILKKTIRLENLKNETLIKVSSVEYLYGYGLQQSLKIERFLSGLIKDYGKYSLSTDGGGTWYPMACEFLKLDHHILLFLAKRRKP